MKCAQLISILVYALAAFWYLVPWLKRQGRAEALIALLWVHVFRYSVLYLPVARHEGYAIPDLATTQLMASDLIGAGLALSAIALLHYRMRLGIAFSWLVLIGTIVDTVIIVHQRGIDPPRADATGIWWVIFVYFAPAVIVSLPFLIWQLYARRKEALAP